MKGKENIMLNEFKKFALKGNMIDLAVGVIIGGAFNAIVTSLVNDIFMPIISIFTGKINFSNLFYALDGKHYDTIAQASAAKVATINYGSFISGVVNFLIMAFVVFLFVRQINKMRAKNEPVAAPTTKKCPHCLSDINKDATKCPYCTSDVE